LFRVFSTFIAVLVVCGTTSGYLNHLNRMDVMESGFQDASWKLLPCHIIHFTRDPTITLFSKLILQ